ncbi:hypothetical protein J3R30DRAFT_3636593 [Lentinula aciculospora]|uniref:Uncharacterized protein n=1 Tax=Lentinula aciculospora TaxID=153920 RepID=A0A9W8ZSC9_9AGAR|nr:hypothetical protein J3R30DRAFT_3636593 [Lentinula aciculospora]
MPPERVASVKSANSINAITSVAETVSASVSTSTVTAAPNLISAPTNRTSPIFSLPQPSSSPAPVPESSNVPSSQDTEPQSACSVPGSSASVSTVPIVHPIDTESHGDSSVSQPSASTSTPPAVPKSSNCVAAKSTGTSPASSVLKSSIATSIVAVVPKNSNTVSSTPKLSSSVSTAIVTETFAPKSSTAITPKSNESSLSSSSGSSGGVPIIHAGMRLSMVTSKPICTKLPAQGIQTAATELWSKVSIALSSTDSFFQTITTIQAIGSSKKVEYDILKAPDILLAQNAPSKNHLFISVSKTVNKSDVVRFNKRWKGHVILQDSQTKHLFYLGEYTGGVRYRLTPSEYNLLPVNTQRYVFGRAKGLLPMDIQDKKELLSSMSSDDGIFIAKTELCFISYRSVIEDSLKQEARKKGFA